MIAGRTAEIERATCETRVRVMLGLDDTAGAGDAAGAGDVAGASNGAACSIDLSCGFLGHMLELFAFHGGFRLEVTGSGDTHVTTITWWRTWGSVQRSTHLAGHGHAAVLMDEALCMVTIDISGRPRLVTTPASSEKVGDFDTELVEEFMQALASNAGLTLHVNVMYGRNTHHIIEAMFKALGRALAQAAAVSRVGGGAAATAGVSVPSSKGVL